MGPEIDKMSLTEEQFQKWDFHKLNMIFGTDSQPFITFISKDGKFKTLGTKMNMVLYNHQSVVRLTPDELIFMGGVNHLFNHVSCKSYKYNIRTSEYVKMGAMIHRRFFSQAVIVQQRLFIIGGRDYGQDNIAILKSCEEYNFETNVWDQIGDLNFPRCNFSSLVYKDNMYVFGGLAKDSSLINNIELFNFDKARWEILGIKFFNGLLGGLSFSKGNEIIVLGGSRAWNEGCLHRINLSHGSDIGEINMDRLVHKNALAKAIHLKNHVLILGGFFKNKIIIDIKSLKVLSDSDKKFNKYSDLISHVDDLCIQSFRLTKSSFVLPFINTENNLEQSRD